MFSKHYSFRLIILVLSLLFLFPVIWSQTTEPSPVPPPPGETASTATTSTNAPSNIAPITVPAKESPKEIPKEIGVIPEDLIHYGDVVEIDVVGSLENDWQGKISPEGFLTELSFAADPIYALCQTEESVAQKIAAAYSKYLREPQVIVRIVDRSSRPVTMLLGAVRNQQRFLLKRAVKLNELVFLAGGITDGASGEIQIFRPEKAGCVQETGPGFISATIADLIAGKPGANPLIRVGDIVTIKEAAPIYVTGGVNNPQKIFARQEITLSRAIASAGNAVKGANVKNIVIYRRENGATAVIEADLDKIAAGQAPDIVLRAFDVVDVPRGGGEAKKQSPVISGLPDQRANNAELPLVIVD